MDRRSTWLVHQKVAPAQPTAVMKLKAPRASAPPKATPNKRLAPDPCSVNAKTSPVTMTATVMSTWATVPLKLLMIMMRGPSQGIAGPVGAASARDLAPSSNTRPHELGRSTRRRRSRMLGLHRYRTDRFQNVATSRNVVRIHARKLSHAAPFGRANDERHQIHRLRHEAWLRRHAGLLDQTVEPQQGGSGAVGMHRGDPAGVPRVPGLEKRQRFSAPHFSHEEAIRPETHRDPDQPGQVRHIARMQLDGVPRLALELARVLEDHDSLGWIAVRDDLAHQGVRERRLTRRCPSGDEDVLAVTDAVEKHPLMRRGQDARLHVVLEAVDPARALPDNEGRRCGDGRQDPLETISIDRQFSLDDRRPAVHHRAEERGNGPDEALDLSLGKAVADLPHPLRVGLDPRSEERVTHHLGHIGIGQRCKCRGPELAAELGVETLLLLGVRRPHASAPTSRFSCTATSPFTPPDRARRWTALRQ